MAIRKLILDDFFEDEQFTLIGIHCNVEDYRLAYLLNQALEISLARKEKDIDNNNRETNYSIFEWEDQTQLNTWNLVSNNCKVESNQIASTATLDSLFSASQIATRAYHLIPEFKKVNYLLKIDSVLNANKEKIILSKIQAIQQVATAYNIEANQLKSKDNLIFN